MERDALTSMKSLPTGGLPSGRFFTVKSAAIPLHFFKLSAFMGFVYKRRNREGDNGSAAERIQAAAEGLS
jgi:hypothetical protein